MSEPGKPSNKTTEIAILCGTNENAAARERVERARKYAVDSGLDKAVPGLWQKVEHWGSWAGMPDRWQPPEGVADVGGGGDREDRFASWSWGGRHYRVGLKRRPNYTPDGDLEFGDIDLAIKVGPWMADLIRYARPGVPFCVPALSFELRRIKSFDHRCPDRS